MSVPARLAAALFFVAPAMLVAAAVSLRTARAVESYRAVMDRVAAFAPAAREAAESQGVELPLLLAVASAESAGRPDARSHADAVGLMQLTAGTAGDMARALGEPRPDLTDPATSLRLGALYLRRQLDRYAPDPSARDLALAAYNAGPGNVDRWLEGGRPASPEAIDDWIPYAETRAFVRRVLDYEARWRQAIASQAPVR